MPTAVPCGVSVEFSFWFRRGHNFDAILTTNSFDFDRGMPWCGGYRYSHGMQCGVSPTGWAGPLGQCPSGLGNYSGINFPGHFGPYPDMFFPTDMGIRSVAAFAWTPLMQYYEGTHDYEFLKTAAYPYLRGIVDFYSSYFTPTRNDSYFHVAYSCGDEICHYEGQEGPSGYALDSHEDLGFARMAFGKALEYSGRLGVDVPLRDAWKDILERLAPYPTTTVPALGPGPGCDAWGCSCQGMSDTYGTNAGVGFGCAPSTAKTWWVAHHCDTKSAKYPCHDPPAPCGAPGCSANASNTLTVFAQSISMDTNQPLPGLSYVGYPIVYDAAIHPAEVITRLSNRTLLAIARNTVWAEGLQSGFNPVNGFVLSWIPIARIVAKSNASALLDNFTAAVAASTAKSWYHDHPGGGYEDVGATEAINSLLLQSIGGALHFFPGWPVGEAASFTQLRAYGAFVVDASVDAEGTVGNITVRSETLGACIFVTPWIGRPRAVDADGTPVQLTPIQTPESDSQWYSFGTAVGGVYTLWPWPTPAVVNKSILVD